MYAVTGSLVFLVVLYVGVSHVRAQSQPSCVDVLDSAISTITSPSPQLCEADVQYMKCILREFDLHFLGVGADYIVRLRNRIHSQLLKQRIDCEFDILEVTREVRLENLAARFNATDIPVQEFDNATNLEDCTEAFIYAATSTGAVTCDIGTSFAKCAARVTKMYNVNLPEADIMTFQQDAELTLLELGANCSIDVPSIIDELQIQAMINLTTSAVEVITSTTTPTTTQSPSLGQDSAFDNATTMADCFDALSGVRSSASLSCQLVRSYTKCMVRFLDLPFTTIPPSKAKSLENQILQQLNALDLGCSLDIQGIIDELLAEQNVQEFSNLTSAVTEVITSSIISTTTTIPTTTEKTTSAPSVPAPSFDDATSVVDCTNALYSPGFNLQAVNCETLTLHTKCIIRVLEIHNVDLPPAVIRSLQSQIQRDFYFLGLSCPLDVQNIIDEVRAEQGTSVTGCVVNKPDGCQNVVNGDYPVCSNECQNGIYITCSNNYLYVSQCPLGWYLTPRGNRITAKTVFDPPTGHCQTKTSSCPRPMDQFVIQ